MKKKNYAYTLIELMVTISIVAILAAVAIPSYNNLLNNSRQSAALNLFLGELYLARSEAVKRSRQVVICASSDGVSCSNSNTWKNGRIIFIDANRDDTFNGTDELLRVGEAIDTRLDMRPSSDVEKFIRYKPNGLSLENGTFILCDQRGADNAKAVVINITGRPQVSEKSHAGGNLACS